MAWTYFIYESMHRNATTFGTNAVSIKLEKPIDSSKAPPQLHKNTDVILAPAVAIFKPGTLTFSNFN